MTSQPRRRARITHHSRRFAVAAASVLLSVTALGCSDEGAPDSSVAFDNETGAIAGCPAPRQPEGPVATTFTPTMQEYDGVRLWYHVPAGPNGLVFAFHGKGGGAHIWFDLTEGRRLAEKLVAAGYGLVSLDSIAGHKNGHTSESKQWSPENDMLLNPDFENVTQSLKHLKNQNLIDDATPIIFMGASNGGGFTSRASTGMDVRAQVLHISRGIQHTFHSDPPPTAWVMARHDQTVPLHEVEPNVVAMKDAGIPHALFINERHPLQPDSMTRIEGVSLQHSTTFYNRMKNNGLLDACDVQIAYPAKGGAWEAHGPQMNPDLVEQVYHQLAEIGGAHTLSSDYADEVIAFIDGLP